MEEAQTEHEYSGIWSFVQLRVQDQRSKFTTWDAPELTDSPLYYQLKRVFLSKDDYNTITVMSHILIDLEVPNHTNSIF